MRGGRKTLAIHVVRLSTTRLIRDWKSGNGNGYDFFYSFFFFGCEFGFF